MGADCGQEAQHPALNAMYNRLDEAEGYGDPQLQACLAFNGAILLPMGAGNALRVLATRRDMAEWEQRRAEEERTEEEQAGE